MWLSFSEDTAPGEIEDYLNLICDRQPLEERIRLKREELTRRATQAETSRDSSH
ncbi:MAG: hypothetical protein U5K84_11770 [Alkalibacterium sp.]|nr:hypothetical protein [Alkalibacterium sp.]